MPERAYTVKEIDQMRDAVEFRWLWGCTPSQQLADSCSRTYKETDMVKCVEEQLRTYMLAGVDPEDLE